MSAHWHSANAFRGERGARGPTPRNGITPWCRFAVRQGNVAVVVVVVVVVVRRPSSVVRRPSSV
eukprot:6973146-Pyramimonas_sp.AAC.2